jgi:carbonic anhydrase
MSDTFLQIIRNAGGSAKEALRSIVISQQLLATQEVLLVKHTDCGMITFQNSDATGAIEKNLGPEAVATVKDQFGGEFLPFRNTEEQVREDVEWLKKNKAIAPDVPISGWIYDVKTGKVKSVV